MSEKKFQLTIAGEALPRADWNTVFEQVGLADDRVFAELLRLTPFGASASKAVLPYRVSDATSPQGLVVPSGIADAKLRIYPFRAFVGSRGALGSIGALANWRDIRSAIGVGSSQLYQEVQFAAGAGGGNHRWDLLWAKLDVDIDAGSETVYVRETDGSETQQSAVKYKHTTVTLGVTQGAPAGVPTYPAIPGDAGSSYYVPLSYVLIPDNHTLATSIPATRIHEVAPIARFTQSGVRPVNHVHKVGGSYLTQVPWTTAARPNFYMAEGGGGKVDVEIPLPFGTTNGLPLNATSIIDDSIDWRKRRFKWMAQFINNTSAPFFAWATPATVPVPGPGFSIGFAAQLGVGQSHYADHSGTESNVAFISNGILSEMAASSSIRIVVDMTTGNLKAIVSSTDPGGLGYIWLEASGHFSNG